MAPPKSNIWLHYTKLSKDLARCNICAKTLKTSGNTSNLNSHLKQKHSKIFLELQKGKNTSKDSDKENKSRKTERECVDTTTGITVHFGPNKETKNLRDDSELTDSLSEVSTVTREPSEASTSEKTGSSSSLQNVGFSILKQPTIIGSIRKVSSYSDGGTHNVKITEAIVKFIVQDNMLFSTVEGKGFISLMTKVAPLYKVPSRNTIKNRVDEKYESASIALKQILKNVQFFTLTTDTWTADMQTKSFMGITIHFIQDLKLVSATLGITELYESHTAAYLGSQLMDTLNTWEINPEKLIVVVTDNATNIVRTVYDKFGKAKHAPCFAHTLNLLCDNSIKNTEGLNELIEKVRSIVVYFKRSVKATDQLRKIQREAGTPEGCFKKMILDVKTRWNSTYYMITRFLELAPQISSIMLSNIDAPVMLSGSELEQLKEIRRLLYPLEQMTNEISGQNYITISKIIPMTACLFERYQNEKNITYEIGNNLKTELLKEFQKRFGSIEKSLLPAISTVLDPRFKNLHFKDPIAISNAIRYLKSEIVQSGSCSSSSSSDPDVAVSDAEEESFDLWAHHKKIAHTKKRTMTSDVGADEVTQYLSIPVRSLKEDPLELWEEMKGVYPNLDKVAMKYFSAVATSVPSERLFSKAGLTATKSRNCLTGKRLSKLLFLNSLPENLQIM